MPLHDVQCNKCGEVIENYYLSSWPRILLHEDGGELEILWRASAMRSALVHPRERAVIFRHPETGEVAYPGRNDAPMPARYREAGYERVEFESAHALERFEREHNVRNEKLWYNSGNEA